MTEDTRKTRIVAIHMANEAYKNLPFTVDNEEHREALLSEMRILYNQGLIDAYRESNEGLKKLL